METISEWDNSPKVYEELKMEVVEGGFLSSITPLPFFILTSYSSWAAISRVLTWLQISWAVLKSNLLEASWAAWSWCRCSSSSTSFAVLTWLLCSDVERVVKVWREDGEVEEVVDGSKKDEEDLLYFSSNSKVGELDGRRNESELLFDWSPPLEGFVSFEERSMSVKWVDVAVWELECARERSGWWDGSWKWRQEAARFLCCQFAPQSRKMFHSVKSIRSIIIFGVWRPRRKKKEQKVMCKTRRLFDNPDLLSFSFTISFYQTILDLFSSRDHLMESKVLDLIGAGSQKTTWSTYADIQTHVLLGDTITIWAQSFELSNTLRFSLPTKCL